MPLNVITVIVTNRLILSKSTGTTTYIQICTKINRSSRKCATDLEILKPIQIMKSQIPVKLYLCWRKILWTWERYWTEKFKRSWKCHRWHDERKMWDHALRSTATKRKIKMKIKKTMRSKLFKNHLQKRKRGKNWNF